MRSCRASSCCVIPRSSRNRRTSNASHSSSEALGSSSSARDIATPRGRVYPCLSDRGFASHGSDAGPCWVAIHPKKEDRRMDATRNVDYSVYLHAHHGATPCARDVLAGKLTEWHMPELIEDGSIIVAELVTNAARLGEVFRMTLRNPGDGMLRIEVEDRSRAIPVRKDPLADLGNDDYDANGGRGLVLVDALADDWGYELLPDGKVVWAVLSK